MFKRKPNNSRNRMECFLMSLVLLAEAALMTGTTSACINLNNLFEKDRRQAESRELEKIIEANLVEEPILQVPPDQSPVEEYSRECEKTPRENYLMRYRELESHFRRHAQEYKPESLDEISFRALLVAIAQKESSLGYPNGQARNNSFLMGYPGGGGATRQLTRSALTIQGALDGWNPNYKKILSKEGDDRIREMLILYNQGERNSQGAAYAKEVMSDYQSWRCFFSREL
ncbi:Uncharacterised protein [uncultured archaeon]|nr:Uncharacterised protein [uncultured archaeon]